MGLINNKHLVKLISKISWIPLEILYKQILIAKDILKKEKLFITC